MKPPRIAGPLLITFLSALTLCGCTALRSGPDPATAAWTSGAPMPVVAPAFRQERPPATGVTTSASAGAAPHYAPTNTPVSAAIASSAAVNWAGHAPYDSFTAAAPAGQPAADNPLLSDATAPARRVAFDPFPADEVAASATVPVIRAQSPAPYGGYASPPPPQNPYAAPASPAFVPAGYGVNSLPTTVYQSPLAPPPGVPAAGVAYQPPFVPQSSIVIPEEQGDLDILLQETQTGRLMLGVGVNSDAGVVGNVVIDEQNFDLFRPSFNWQDWVNGTAFRGGGQHLRIEAVPGTQVQRYSFSFQEPYFLDTPVSLGLSAFYFQRNYSDWEEQRTGGRISLGYIFPYRRDLSITGSFGAESVKISNPTVPTPDELNRVVGNNDLYTFRLLLAHDTRDSTFMPTRGHYVGVTLEEGLGSFQYPRGDVDARQYWVLYERPDRSGRHVLGLSGKVGFSGNDTPLFEHYFAGGFSSIRGFDFRGASPRDLGVIVGGNFQALASAEYRFPLTASDVLYGSFFVDTGVVEPDITLKGSDVRIAPGFELRISVPALGPVPIALGIGVPVQKVDGDSIRNFHFYLGITR